MNKIKQAKHMADIIIFESCQEAHILLDNMELFLKAFGRVSIDNLYTMTASLGYDDPPCDIGWTDLSKARVKCIKSDPYPYYKIKWPPVEAIESTENLKWGFKEYAKSFGYFKKGTTLI